MHSLRQIRLSTLAKSELKNIQSLWQNSIDDFDFEFIRQLESGMVMMTARSGGTGEPFNLGEVSISRCAIRLNTGETGIGYVQGRNKQHAIHIALIDALAQSKEHSESILQDVIQPLQLILQQQQNKQKVEANKSKVDFFTMVRGED